jgi:hypothetical protein
MVIMQVYIDESGDLGFSSKSTRFFVVSFMITRNHMIIDLALKRILKKLHKRKKYSQRSSELKFSNSNNAVKNIVLKKIM